MTGPRAALFTVDGSVAIPDSIACGPWSADTLHGGAVAALVAQLADDEVGGSDGRLARLGLHLLRPVPRAPLRVAITALRTGLRVATHEIALRAGDDVVVTATALRVRAPAPDLPPLAPTAHRSPPSNARGTLQHHECCAWPAFNRDAIELRHVPENGVDADASAWTRLTAPVIAERTTSAAARAAAAADLAGGIGARLPSDRYRCVNAEITLHLERLPTTDWIAMRAATLVGTHGAGTAEAELFDAAGRIGRAAQTLVIDTVT